MSLLHVPGSGIAWVGLESYSGATITSGLASLKAHIVYIDLDHKVDIQTASIDTILIHNYITSATLAGNVTLVW